MADNINGTYIWIEKSPVISSTNFKNIDDNSYCNTSLKSRNVSFYECQSSKVTRYNDKSTDKILQLSSSANKLNNNRNKGKNIRVNNSNVIFTSTSATIRDPSIKFNIFSDLQLKNYQLNLYSKKRVYQFVKNKNSTLNKNIYHRRINLEGQRKVDFMYYLTKRHNFVPVTEKIFSYLCGKDIITMSLVSKIWFNAIKCSPTAKLTKKYFLLYMESIKENHNCTDHKHTSLMSRRTLGDIGNIIYSMPKYKFRLLNNANKNTS